MKYLDKLLPCIAKSEVISEYDTSLNLDVVFGSFVEENHNELIQELNYTQEQVNDMNLTCYQVLPINNCFIDCDMELLLYIKKNFNTIKCGVKVINYSNVFRSFLKITSDSVTYEDKSGRIDVFSIYSNKFLTLMQTSTDKFYPFDYFKTYTNTKTSESLNEGRPKKEVSPDAVSSTTTKKHKISAINKETVNVDNPDLHKVFNMCADKVKESVKNSAPLIEKSAELENKTAATNVARMSDIMIHLENQLNVSEGIVLEEVAKYSVSRSKTLIPFLYGLSGVMKSQMVKNLVEKYNDKFRYVEFRLSFMDSIDFKGFNHIDDIEKIVNNPELYKDGFESAEAEAEFNKNKVDDINKLKTSWVSKQTKGMTYAYDAKLYECSDQFLQYANRMVNEVSVLLEDNTLETSERVHLENLLNQYKEKLKIPVMFFDELPRASSSVVGSLFNLFDTSRSFEGLTFKNARMFAAGNLIPYGDKLRDAKIFDSTSEITSKNLFEITKFPKAFNARFLKIPVDSELIEENWLNWAMKVHGDVTSNTVSSEDMGDVLKSGSNTVDGSNNPVSGEFNIRDFSHIHPLIIEFIYKLGENTNNSSKVLYNYDFVFRLYQDFQSEIFHKDDKNFYGTGKGILNATTYPNYRSWATVSEYLYNCFKQVDDGNIKFTVDKEGKLVYSNRAKDLKNNKTKKPQMESLDLFEATTRLISKVAFNRFIELGKKYTNISYKNYVDNLILSETVIKGLLGDETRILSDNYKLDGESSKIVAGDAFVNFLKDKGFKFLDVFNSNNNSKINDALKFNNKFDDAIINCVEFNIPLLMAAPGAMGKTSRIIEYCEKRIPTAEFVMVNLQSVDRSQLRGGMTKKTFIKNDLDMLGNLENFSKKTCEKLEFISKKVVRELKMPSSTMTCLTPLTELVNAIKKVEKRRKNGEDALLVVFFDEVNRVSEKVILSCLFEAISDHRLFGTYLNPEYTRIVAACNMGTDEKVKELDQAFSARFCIVAKPTLDVSDAFTFVEYVKTHPNKFSPSVIGFLTYLSETTDKKFHLRLRSNMTMDSKELGENPGALNGLEYIIRLLKSSSLSEMNRSVPNARFFESLSSLMLPDNVGMDKSNTTYAFNVMTGYLPFTKSSNYTSYVTPLFKFGELNLRTIDNSDVINVIHKTNPVIENYSLGDIKVAFKFMQKYFKSWISNYKGDPFSEYFAKVKSLFNPTFMDYIEGDAWGLKVAYEGKVDLPLTTMEFNSINQPLSSIFSAVNPVIKHFLSQNLSNKFIEDNNLSEIYSLISGEKEIDLDKKDENGYYSYGHEMYLIALFHSNFVACFEIFSWVNAVVNNENELRNQRNKLLNIGDTADEYNLVEYYNNYLESTGGFLSDSDNVKNTIYKKISTDLEGYIINEFSVRNSNDYAQKFTAYATLILETAEKIGKTFLTTEYCRKFFDILVLKFQKKSSSLNSLIISSFNKTPFVELLMIAEAESVNGVSGADWAYDWYCRSGLVRAGKKSDLIAEVESNMKVNTVNKIKRTKFLL